MAQSIRFEHVVDGDGSGVLVILNGRRLVTLGWKASLEACRALDAQLRNVLEQRMTPLARALAETRVCWRGQGLAFRQELDRLVVLGGNPERLLFDMRTDPTGDGGPSQARQIWSEWLRVTRIAEEHDKHEQVTRDAAILHRSGAPFGIATNPLIRKDAAALAQHDTDLRRFMPNGIRSAAVLPPPTIHLDTRPPGQVLRALLPGMGRADRGALMAALKGS